MTLSTFGDIYLISGWRWGVSVPIMACAGFWAYITIQFMCMETVLGFGDKSGLSDS